MRRDVLETFHPAIVFAFFVVAIVLAVLASDPAFLAINLICSAAYYLCLKGRTGWKVVLGMVPLFVALMLVNPLFNTMGDTILFTWLGGRPYTLEALAYGAVTAAMFVAVLLWFFSYNRVMTTDKFTYLFGGLMPALTLVFTMVLRLVPTYQRKATEIMGARDCIGHSVARGTVKERSIAATSLLSSLTAWALEGGVITADSMRSRGYGVGKRTSFALYRFTRRDVVLLLVLAVLATLAFVGYFAGVTPIEYYPVIAPAAYAPLGLVGLLASAAFLAIPTILDLWETASWRISLSKI